MPVNGIDLSFGMFLQMQVRTEVWGHIACMIGIETDRDTWQMDRSRCTTGVFCRAVVYSACRMYSHMHVH